MKGLLLAGAVWLSAGIVLTAFYTYKALKPLSLSREELQLHNQATIPCCIGDTGPDPHIIAKQQALYVPSVDEHVLRVDDRQPIKVVNLVYPTIAKYERVRGPVVLDVVIGKTGAVENAYVLKGHPLLVMAALSCVKQWRWEPFLMNGKAVRVRTRAIVKFRLH